MTKRIKTHEEFYALSNIRYMDQLAANWFKLMPPDNAYYVGDGCYILPDGTWIDDEDDDEDDDDQGDDE